MKTVMRFSVVMALLVGFVVLQARAQAPAAPVPAAPAPGVPAGNGSITGKVTFTGTPPTMPALKREADPFCGKTKMSDEEVVVNANGGLKNVYIRISQGAPAAPAPAMPAVLNQDNCMYSPRVVAVMKGQRLLIRNGDPVLHNVHSYMGTATSFNQAMFKGMKDIEKTFDQVGMIKFKCDVHPWMTAWVGVSDNPFFAVTGGDGAFTIANVPAGAYTLEAWHEKYGTKTVQVTVAAGQPAPAAFSYAAQ